MSMLPAFDTRPNTRLVDLIFEAVQMKIELTRCQIRDSERNLERLTHKYGCGPDDLADLLRGGRLAISQEDALAWCGELVRLEQLREDEAHLSLLT